MVWYTASGGWPLFAGNVEGQKQLACSISSSCRRIGPWSTCYCMGVSAGDSRTESVSWEDKKGDIHVTLELVEVGALIVDLLAQLGEPITDHG